MGSAPSRPPPPPRGRSRRCGRTPSCTWASRERAGSRPATIVLGAEAVYCDATWDAIPRRVLRTPACSRRRARSSPTRRCSRSGRADASVARRRSSRSRRWRASRCSAPRAGRSRRHSRFAPSRTRSPSPIATLWRFDEALEALAAAIPRLLLGTRVSAQSAARRRSRPRRGRSASSSRRRFASTAITSGACCRSGSRSP